jgi:GNAT superfamily N-acetyltransferase
MNYEVKRLVVNYKTLEEFKQFKEYGIQELSMLEDLQDNIIENDSESPFYGIYYGDKLVARMSLYKIESAYDKYFEPSSGYLELWKLEVLPHYKGKGLGSALVEYAKTFNLPVKTNGRQQSSGFWEKMGFEPVSYVEERDRGENPYVWYPQGVSEQRLA